MTYAQGQAGEVGSVSLFLERLEGMRISSVPGAAEAYGALEKRGLTAGELARVRALLTASHLAPAPAPMPDPAAAIAAVDQARREAYDALVLWYVDWAETLRDELDYHERVRLGISEAKGGRSNRDDDTAAPAA